MRLLITILLITMLVSCVVFSKTSRHQSPPGTILLKDDLYIDTVEVYNIAWKEFAEFWTLNTKRDDSTYETLVPDTTVWGEDNKPFGSFYYREKELNKFNYYPVVGVSYEQAVAFCEWRSEMVNMIYAKYPARNPIKGKNYKYRLPTVEEWEFAAAGGLPKDLSPFGFPTNIIQDSLWSFFNYRLPLMGNGDPVMPFPKPVTAYKRNGFGIYNMIGNLSEMTSEKGIAKGGNYTLPLESCKITNQQNYTKPEAWLGFRCVCEVID